MAHKYCLLTKQPDDSFDVPVRWTGNNLAKIPKNLISETLTSDAKKNGGAALFGVFPIEEPKPPIGKIEDGPAVDTFDGQTVARAAPLIDDPNYVAPDQLAEARASAVLAIKAESRRRIFAVVPDYVQWNTLRDGTGSDVNAMRSLINPIRTKSDSLEADVSTMTLEQVYAFDVTDDANWI